MGYDGHNGCNMSTRFNTSPNSLNADFGCWDAGQRAFIFDDGVN